MMPALFSPFAWLMGSTLVIWMGAALLIRFDFYRMSRERQQGNAPSWYTRPLLWFAAAAITFSSSLGAVSVAPSFAAPSIAGQTQGGAMNQSYTDLHQVDWNNVTVPADVCHTGGPVTLQGGQAVANSAESVSVT